LLRIILLAVSSSGPIETVSLQSQLRGVSRSSDMDSGPIDTMSLKSQLCGVSRSSDMYRVDLAFGLWNALPIWMMARGGVVPDSCRSRWYWRRIALPFETIACGD
jgi:hypothetical protein